MKRSFEQIKNILEPILGPLNLIGSGYHSFVFRFNEKVLKVYQTNDDLHHLEAEKMKRAGFGHFVLDVFELNGLPILEMPYFEGKTLCKTNIYRALPEFFDLLNRVHQKKNGDMIDQNEILLKLNVFRQSINGRNCDFLFDFVRKNLENNVFLVEKRLCHLDLWCANILVDTNNKVFIADWVRSDWDDPARDLAIFTTGTLDRLPVEEAKNIAVSKAEELGMTDRFRGYMALQTLNDIYWFKQNEPENLVKIADEKLFRALEIIKT